MGIFASRGEARSVALALRLSEASYLSSVKGEEANNFVGRCSIRDGFCSEGSVC
ncbi:MAG: hypothetical protein CM1200mP35_04090 [Chloroflexota bacterium]|nr:MAG: hypothetical protein CM1200mP35_04090 [Chloroflexota bacterium]